MEKGRAESLSVLGKGGENHRREAWTIGTWAGDDIHSDWQTEDRLLR
jgi:hypothetical protein